MNNSQHISIYELHEKLSEYYPRSLSASWDNDGIMVSPDVYGEVRRVLISLDATAELLKYAAENKYDTIITHHPMIFKPVKTVSSLTLTGSKALYAIRNGISVMSFHTRLDAADGGVNDELCRILGFPFSGKFEDDEVPALGRICDIPEMTAGELAGLVRDRLGCSSVRLNGDAEHKITRVGVCGGDGKSFVYPALREGCQAFITGDAVYNTALDAADEGLVTIEAGHFHTENPVCGVLRGKISELCGIDADIYDSCGYTII